MRSVARKGAFGPEQSDPTCAWPVSRAAAHRRIAERDEPGESEATLIDFENWPVLPED
jgi:hypothetical protein